MDKDEAEDETSGSSRKISSENKINLNKLDEKPEARTSESSRKIDSKNKISLNKLDEKPEARTSESSRKISLKNKTSLNKLDEKPEVRTSKSNRKISSKNKISLHIFEEKPKVLPEIPKVTLSNKFVFDQRTSISDELFAVSQAKELISEVVERESLDRCKSKLFRKRPSLEKASKRRSAGDKAKQLISQVSLPDVAFLEAKENERVTVNAAVVEKAKELLSAVKQKDISTRQPIRMRGRCTKTAHEEIALELGGVFQTLKIEDLEHGKK
ncbi:hypothetical protein TNIN_130581 [Trichonephila inaurata madagascariensis]|uniref:Uncharacterized protein n=1 Tax=Trichonephila inaurata madagascariensis TaxID=2747483 RepID=A0A8X6XP17_9ARAC|nr:hypothetical protein TNIN_130581 [Trichonephila inaurata madagascariensis]